MNLRIFKLAALAPAFFLCLLCVPGWVVGQSISGNVKDEKAEPVIGATIRVLGQTAGGETDENGDFNIPYTGKLPVKIRIDYVGYDSIIVEVATLSKPLKFTMKEAKLTETETVEVVGSRIVEKTQNNPQTMVTMDNIAIQQAPTENFYKGLGNMKDVDITSASMGFTIINTRGFNSTRPVRSLQLIDMVDNAAPGLNFSLGNMVGASELDVQSVDLIVGANSTMYGPGAFNGVISMNTKNPFIHQGLTFQMKVGERQLLDGAVRFARSFKNKQGRDVFAFKINTAFMRAYDWEATNLQQTSNSKAGPDNLGGYDAINRYGDETDFKVPTSSKGGLPSGITPYQYRTGYMEKDLADYNTKSIKVQGALHYKIRDSLELIYAYNFGTGTTIFQGDNRFSIKDLIFQQHIVELKGKKFDVKAYTSLEDAGKSYDIVRTAFLMQNDAKSNENWNRAYNRVITQYIRPNITKQEGYVDPTVDPAGYDAFINSPQMQALLVQWHDSARKAADGAGTFLVPGDPRLVPGTPEFNEKFRQITSSTKGSKYGTRFLDQSKLYHVQGHYILSPKNWFDLRLGGNFRYYTPQSWGTIFEDTLVSPEASTDKKYKAITNWEVGAYFNFEKKLLKERLRVNAAMRMDKNQNFNFQFSPAVSALYKYKDHVFRVSFAQAIRNPTLQDQYLYFNLGLATLIGNLNGRQNVVSLDDYRAYLNDLTPDYNKLKATKAFNIDPIRPEKARTLEAGWRGTVFKKYLYLDVTGYISWYQDFLGFQLVQQLPDAAPSPGAIVLPEVYRVTANAPQTVRTYGASVGWNFYFAKYFEINGNYSWNRLDKSTSDTTGRELTNAEKAQFALLPAFNTPEHKFNVGINARDLIIPFGKAFSLKGLGFNLNFKWVQGFRFEGSPQFTGSIPTYYTLDAQVNYSVKKWNTMFKLGASNITNNQFIQVYGGPYVGRMAYFQITIDVK